MTTYIKDGSIDSKIIYTYTSPDKNESEKIFHSGGFLEEGVNQWRSRIAVTSFVKIYPIPRRDVQFFRKSIGKTL